ncbi:MAG: VPLPA-CTERM sorting domain-containing protein [Gammaproteobacteria bacterium]
MRKFQIALAVSVIFGVSSAQAAIWQITNLVNFSSQGASTAVLSGNTLFTSDVANNLTANGSFTGQFNVGPTPIYAHEFTGMTISNAGAVDATAFTCVEGAFGAAVGANICANTGFGTNFVNESTVTYTGNTSSRTIGGDDIPFGPQQMLSDYDGLAPIDFGPGFSYITFSNTIDGTQGVELTLTQVPVPAAAWLFGSALGLLGWARRRTS